MMSARKPRTRLALVVCPGLERLSALQDAFSQAGFEVIVARDLPTALLAVSQHDFSACIVSSRIAEAGDGYVLGAVLRRIFPPAYVAILAREASVPELQAAINHGVDQLFEDSTAPADLAAEARSRISGDLVALPARKVQ